MGEFPRKQILILAGERVISDHPDCPVIMQRKSWSQNSWFTEVTHIVNGRAGAQW